MAQEARVEDKDFDAAFGEAAAVAEKEVQAKEPVKKEEPVAQKTAEQLAAEETAAKVAEAKAAEEAAAKEKADAEAAAKTEANKGKTPEVIAAEAKVAKEKADAEAAAKAKEAADAKARQEAEVKKTEVKKAEPRQETEAEKAARLAFEESIKPYEPTAEEKAAYEKFKKDFPEEAKAIEAQQKAAERTHNRRLYETAQAVLQQVYKDFTPIAEGYSADSQERHFAALHTAHKDYDEVIAQVPAWIEKQPAYLKTAYQQAYDEGSTQEVIDLVTRYKQETGRTAAPVKEEIKSDTKKGPTPEEIAAGLPVNTKRAAPAAKGAPDPNDYDGAFAEATASK